MNQEIHVFTMGDDNNSGSETAPLKTISEASRRAMPGDIITVHSGTYREHIDPPRGGTSLDKPIIYRAAPGEKVVIKGSEEVQHWTPFRNRVFQLVLANEFFGDDNPFGEKLDGHWFLDQNKIHHRGSVYVNEHWLAEADSLEDLLSPHVGEARWWGQVNETHTTLYAEFKGADPDHVKVEVSVRDRVFYPSKAGINYLVVRGFHMMHAATPWAPPTTEQVGVLGTHWGKGWVIEDNHIAYSACSGITLGKFRDPDDFRPLVEFTNKDTYHETIDKAHARGWNQEIVGGHLVRRNEVSHCEMAGICGSLGAINCVIEDNHVHHIHVRRRYFGYEMAGIKFHAPIDSMIRHNRIHHCYRGIWLDWMTQGTRVSANILWDNGPMHDLFIEVNHGPFVIDNNLLLSPLNLQNWSEGGLYAHNLFAGKVEQQAVLNRTTPYHPIHSTEVAEMRAIVGGDDSFINNIFCQANSFLGYKDDEGNPSVFLNNNLCEKAIKGKSPAHVEQLLPEWFSCERDGYLHLNFKWTRAWPTASSWVQGKNLKATRISQQLFLDYDGKLLQLDEDVLGQKRSEHSPCMGPWEVSNATFHTQIKI